MSISSDRVGVCGGDFPATSSAPPTPPPALTSSLTSSAPPTPPPALTSSAPPTPPPALTFSLISSLPSYAFSISVSYSSLNFLAISVYSVAKLFSILAKS